MKKLFIGLAALFVLLSFSGCKKDVPVSTVELQQAFYVTENPEDKEWAQVLELPRTTDFTALKKDYYYLIVSLYQPDFDAKTLIVDYGYGKLEYDIDDDRYDYIFWRIPAWWGEAENYPTTLNLSFYIISDNGAKSNVISYPIVLTGVEE